MGRAEKATRTSPVSEQVRSRCFCAHFLHSNRAVALLMPKIRLPQAAEGLLIPSCLFGPGRAETNRPSFLSLRPFCLFALPSQQQHQISSNCRQRQSESRGSSGDRSGSRKKERQQQGQQQQRQRQQRQRQQRQRQQRQAAEAAEAEAEAAAATATHQQPAATGHRGSCSRAAARPASCKHSSSSSGGSGSSHPAN